MTKVNYENLTAAVRAAGRTITNIPVSLIFDTRTIQELGIPVEELVDLLDERTQSNLPALMHSVKNETKEAIAEHLFNLGNPEVLESIAYNLQEFRRPFAIEMGKKLAEKAKVNAAKGNRTLLCALQNKYFFGRIPYTQRAEIFKYWGIEQPKELQRQKPNPNTAKPKDVAAAIRKITGLRP